MKVRTVDTENGKTNYVTIGRVDLKGKILSIEDTTNYSKLGDVYEKVMLNCTAYAEGSDSINMRHYMDIDDILLVANDIIANRGVVSNGATVYRDFKYVEYKGGENQEYNTGYESRVLSIELNPKMGDGKGAYVVKFTAGPGTPTSTRAVMPAKGGATKDLSMVIQVPAMRTLMNMVDVYLRAKLTAVLTLSYNSLFKRA